MLRKSEIRNEVFQMEYTLMHKRIAVADIQLDDETGYIQKVDTVYAPEHLPIGVNFKKRVANRADLNNCLLYTSPSPRD